jgi:hypothetical protein
VEHQPSPSGGAIILHMINFDAAVIHRRFSVPERIVARRMQRVKHDFILKNKALLGANYAVTPV